MFSFLFSRYFILFIFFIFRIPKSNLDDLEIVLFFCSVPDSICLLCLMETPAVATHIITPLLNNISDRLAVTPESISVNRRQETVWYFTTYFIILYSTKLRNTILHVIMYNYVTPVTCPYPPPVTYHCICGVHRLSTESQSM